MNDLTAQTYPNPSPQIERTGEGEVQHVDKYAGPKSWSHMHRLKWGESRPDNRVFWRAVEAVSGTFTQRGAGRKAAFKSVASFMAATEHRVCNAAVATMAKRAQLGPRAFRVQLRWLEAAGLIWADPGVSKGRSTTVYRMGAALVEALANPTVKSEYKAKQPGRECRQVSTSVQYVHKQAAYFRKRETCEKHARSWFTADGLDCFECNRERARCSQRPKRPATLPPRLRVGAPHTQGPTAADDLILAALKASGWRKGGTP